MSGHRGNRRHANGWRRQQVVARVLAAYDTCHLCGRPVDKSLPPGLPGSPEVDEIIRRLSVPVSGGAAVLVEAIRVLDLAGVELTDVALRRPTLDDVFLSLTGHGTEGDS